MLDITKCPILNSDKFTVDNNEQNLGPKPEELTAFEGKAKNLIDNFNKLEMLLNDIKATYPNKYNVDGIWGTCSNGLKGIEKVIRKPCIQIGFIGGSNVGKSSTINRLFGDLAGTGQGGMATSSAVVSYYVADGGQDKWSVSSMEKIQLDKKKDIAIKNLLFALQLSGEPNDERSNQKIEEKIQQSGGIPDKFKATWAFINAMKNDSVHPFADKDVGSKHEFRELVNHTTGGSGHSGGHAVFYGRATGLPQDTPKVLEIVDVPGVGMTLQDDYLVQEYNPRIDAWIMAYGVNLYDGSGITENVHLSRGRWGYKNGNINGDKTCRFSVIINKLGTLGINLVKAHEDGWNSLSSLFGKERFFLLDTNIGGKYGEEIFNNSALDPNSDIKDLVENPSVFAEFTKAKVNDRSNYDQCFPKHLVGFKKYEQLIRQCMFDGGISNFRRFLLYQWPIQIVSEIIAKSESDISEFLVDAENLNTKLRDLEKLNPNEITNIQNATAALTKIKVEISKAGFKPLADGLKDLINQAVAVHTYTPTTSISQVINWLKTEAKLGATNILSQIVLDGGLIDECYKYIENQGNFSAHDLRVSPTNRDTLKLDAIWKKTLPLRRDILNPRMQQDIRNLLIPHEVIISFIEQEFWNTLKNKTGIDELLADLTMVRHSETGEIKIDMFDWAQSILTYQNNLKNYERLDSLIKEAVNNLAVDCAEVIKNFCLEQINKLIDERQAILFLCT